MRERIRRNVGLGMAVILLVSSLGVPPASAGTVREGKSLAEAEMAVLSGPVEYNGSEQKPKVSDSFGRCAFAGGGRLPAVLCR